MINLLERFIYWFKEKRALHMSRQWLYELRGK